jgi:hypothetical protein
MTHTSNETEVRILHSEKFDLSTDKMNAAFKGWSLRFKM